MAFLESLAAGLRGAGGILSPEVYNTQNQEERMMTQLAAQRDALRLQLAAHNRDLMAQQIFKGAEAGAITPEAAQARLRQIGIDVPVGPSLETQAVQETIARRNRIGQEVSKLPEEDRSNPLKLADIFMRNGDYATGSKYIDTHETRQARMQQAKDALDARMTELQLRLNDQALNREQRTQIAQMMDETKRQGLALQAQIASGNQALRALQIEAMKQNQSTKESDRQDKSVENLSKRLGGDSMLTSLMTSVDRVNSMIEPYTMEKGGKIVPKEDIPGLGYGTTIPGAQFVLSEKGKQIRASVQGAANDLLKLYSGGAVTMNEGERRQVEMMASGKFSQQDFLNAWPLITDRLNASLSNIKAGYTPQTVDTYLQRGGVSLDKRKPFKSLGSPTGEWSIKEKK